jgi:indolepyruvate decarboxylase
MFGVPGDFNLWFLEHTIKGSDIRFVGCCNELNAAYAADGYARLAGISALVTTYGVGELASLAGIAGAYAERVPMVCITGAPPVHAMRERALLHHTMADGNFDNTLACFREFTVAQTRIDPPTARSEIDRVLRSCWLEKRPVYLQLPSDVAGVWIPPATEPLELDPPRSDPRQLRRAIRQISERFARAYRPAILLDADADRFGWTEILVALAEAQGVPIAHLLPARGVVSDSHPLSIGTYRGAASVQVVRAAVEDSDCLLCVGTRFTDVATGLFTHRIRPEAVIDLQPYSVKLDGEFFSAVTAVELLTGLVHRAKKAAALSSRAPPPAAKPPAPTIQGALTQAVFWQHIQQYLRPRDVVVTDTGTSYFASSNLTLPQCTAFIAQPVWASLGYALPAALGTGLAASDRRQLIFLGDGAFQMTVQEISTILRLELKPIIFLINNDGYTIERLIFGSHSSYNDLNPWHYGRIPAALDKQERAVVHSVRTEAELRTALHAASDASRLHFIELVLAQLDAPEALVRFAQRAAEFDFPQMCDEDEAGTVADLHS